MMWYKCFCHMNICDCHMNICNWLQQRMIGCFWERWSSGHVVNTCVWCSLISDCLPFRPCIWWGFQTLSQTSCSDFLEKVFSLWFLQDVLKHCILSIQEYPSFKGGQINLWRYCWMNILQEKIIFLVICNLTYYCYL